jgi:phage gp29-like protein
MRCAYPTFDAHIAPEESTGTCTGQLPIKPLRPSHLLAAGDPASQPFQPIREGTYDANDELGREKLSKDMNEMGGSATFLHPKNTELKFIESGDKTGSSDLYHTFNTVNELAITILYLGNNLTTNSGDKGARSLGEIQQKDQKEIICDDKKFLIGVLNSEPFKTYFNLYYPEAKGGVFQFIEDRDIDTKTKADVYDIASKYVPIPDKEWYQLMDMSVPDNLEQLKAERQAQLQARNDAMQNGTGSDNTGGKSPNTKAKNGFSFFG